MKKAAFLFAAITSMAISGTASADDVPMDSLLKEVKSALLIVQNSPSAADLPKLQSVSIDLTTVQKKQADGTFKLFVVEFGGSKSGEVTTSVSMTLIPPPANASKSVGVLSIDKALANAILSAADAIHSAQKGAPPLTPSEVKASIKFAVSQDGTGKLNLVISPVTASLGGTLTSSSTQEIDVIYKN